MTLETRNKGLGISSPSKNDLFDTDWSSRPSSSHANGSNGSYTESSRRPPTLSLDEDAYAASSNVNITPRRNVVNGSPRTASFFDTSSSSSPTPAPRLTQTIPSPLNLSRGPSVHSHSRSQSQPRRSGSGDPLSPLHQSPSIPSPTASGSTWQPPLPPNNDVELRFMPKSTYLLGEGRYAKVYLASYRTSAPSGEKVETEVTENGDGLVGGSWRLCAAKWMEGGRQSQTMGLREAFFLNRLTGDSGGKLTPRSDYAVSSGEKKGGHEGKVHVIKLIAVKEEIERKSPGHTRSSSLASPLPSRQLQRKRSTTLTFAGESLAPTRSEEKPDGVLAKAFEPDTAPSSSRFVLLLEHAPLGTLDRVLRSSPAFVGRDQWLKWARQGTAALEWISSQGVVHADVKPGNILLNNDFDLRLSDFGSSLLIDQASPPTDGIGLGTLPFSPPELVDPHRSFSFPVDIFAFGATLYQCITGREPYRGMRTIEMMHHVRRGDLWSWEERARINRIGDEEQSTSSSPYPSAWRANAQENLRRGGSLRVTRDSSPLGIGGRPRLPRMSSAGSLRATGLSTGEMLDKSDGPDSPAGIRLWTHWVNNSVPSTPDAISALLSEISIETVPRRQGAYKASASTLESISPIQPEIPPAVLPSSQTSNPTSPITKMYQDGTPVMSYLDSEDIVSDEIRQVIRSMVDPAEEMRPSASYLRKIWTKIGVVAEQS